VDGAGGVTTTNLLYNGTVDYGGGVLTSEGSFGSVAIASFDASGKYRWAYAGGAPSTATISAPAGSMAVAASGTEVIVTGVFGGSGGTLVLGGSKLKAVSAQDVFLDSLSP
jgi:hypothetical protein